MAYMSIQPNQMPNFLLVFTETRGDILFIFISCLRLTMETIIVTMNRLFFLKAGQLNIRVFMILPSDPLFHPPL